jgi:F0F1-type ATP synthase gamma subunit
MASERELRKRIRSVTNIAQVTKALEAVGLRVRRPRRRHRHAALLARPTESRSTWPAAGAGALLHPLLGCARSSPAARSC